MALPLRPAAQVEPAQGLLRPAARVEPVRALLRSALAAAQVARQAGAQESTTAVQAPQRSVHRRSLLMALA
jgi:hypothetical protein